MRPGAESAIVNVSSKDGTRIAVECAGAGPRLILIHGGADDRSRWRPLFPRFEPRFTVCAMDRRGHGESGDSTDYKLEREFEDVAAVVDSRPGAPFLLGHSFGALCALGAALLTQRISKLVLYEPPLQAGERFIDLAIVSRMEKMIQAGDYEQALVLLLQKFVKASPLEIAVMKTRASWPARVAGMHTSIRELRAIDAYPFDAETIRKLNIPTLLLMGSRTPAHHKAAIHALQDTLPNRTLAVFEHHKHSAMDTAPELFADVVTNFLLGRP